MPPPLDEEEFRRWRDEAGRALVGVRVQADAELFNWACFAAEQSAQLALKGLLHELGRAPWGHDVLRLAAMLGDASLEVPDAIESRLRRSGVTTSLHATRTPIPSGPPGFHYGSSDAQEAMDDATEILDFVDRTWEGLE